MFLDLLRKILEDHWRQVEQSAASPLIKRSYNLMNLLETPEIAVITGVRRSGKSHLMRSLAYSLSKNFPVLYLDFEDSRLTEFKVEDWFTLYEQWLTETSPSVARRYILIDEVQDSPRWERSIITIAKNPNTKVIVTGSNFNLLSSELSSYLTGRHQTLHITPLSWSEIAEYEGVNERTKNDTLKSVQQRRIFEKYKERGGFPRSYLSETRELLRHYYEDIVLKDIVLRRGVRNLAALKEFSRLLATDNCSLFNLSRISRHLGIKDQQTIKRFAQYFIETYLYRDLRCYNHSLRKQQRSHPKFYCVDHALARENGLISSPNFGRELENLVCCELFRRYKEIYYWKSAKGFEVDFIIREGTKPIAAIQVCQDLSNPDVREKETRGLRAAKTELGIKELLIVTDRATQADNAEDASIAVRTFMDWAAGQPQP